MEEITDIFECGGTWLTSAGAWTRLHVMESNGTFSQQELGHTGDSTVGCEAGEGNHTREAS